MTAWRALLLAAVLVSSCAAQEAAAQQQPQTREELIQKERRERAAQLKPERPSRWEERIRLLKEKRSRSGSATGTTDCA